MSARRRTNARRDAIIGLVGQELTAFATAHVPSASGPVMVPLPEVTLAEELAALAEERAAAVRETAAAVLEISERLDQARREAALGAAERDALREELDQRSGEAQALRSRLREEISLRADSVQRVEALERDLARLASDVLGADVTRQKRGLFRRTPRAPIHGPAARTTRPELAPPAGAMGAQAAGEDVESVLDRRLFGS